MKKQLLLIIYILSYSLCFSQSISLEYISPNPQTIKEIDSLAPIKKHQNLKQLIKSNDSTLKQLKKHYGYLNLLAQPLSRINDSTYTQKITPGRKYKIAKLTLLEGDKIADSLFEITLSRKRKEDYTPIEKIEYKLSELQNTLNKNGYAFSKIETTNIKYNRSDTVEIEIKIHTNKPRRIDHVKIKGYEKFPRRYIDNIVKRKYALNDKNIEKIKDAFKKMPFIDIIKEPELLFKQDSTTLYIYAQKKQNNLVDGLIGFNNSDGTKLEINGTLDLQLNNNLNKGEQLNLSYRSDHEDQTKLDLSINLPYILKTKIGINGGLNILRRDSTYQNSSFKTGVFYSFNPTTKTGLNYIKTSSTAEETITSNSFDTQSLQINFNHYTNSPDDLFIYDELALIEIESGTRNTETQKTKQFKIKIELEKHIHLTQKQSINANVKLLTLESNDILFNELFQVGGINSIRGFNQNSIDTSFFTALNTEYRYRLSRGIYLHSILDYGIFEDYITKKTQNVYGIGIGTAILTQSGILRISIANGAFSGANSDFSSTVAHLNLKIRF